MVVPLIKVSPNNNRSLWKYAQGVCGTLNQNNSTKHRSTGEKINFHYKVEKDNVIANDGFENLKF